jgi:hypothetical protein
LHDDHKEVDRSADQSKNGSFSYMISGFRVFGVVAILFGSQLFVER